MPYKDLDLAFKSYAKSRNNIPFIATILPYDIL